MLRDVLAALKGAGLFEQILLVSRDERALLLAPDLGVVGLVEADSHGYSAAATQAAVAARTGGAPACWCCPATCRWCDRPTFKRWWKR